MLRTIIVDDEPKNRKLLVSLLSEFCPQVKVEGEAGSADEAAQLIQQVNPELVLLDIEMPYGNAFDLLDKLMPVDFEIIFITAFDEYTLKAFKYSALDYLLKPVDIAELQVAIEKAAKKIHLRTINQQLTTLLQNMNPAKNPVPKIALPTQEGFVFTAIHDIVRLEASGNYTLIYTTDGHKHISAKTIQQYEKVLPPGQFFRIHNSHMVNLNFIKRYHKGRGGEVEMTDGVVLEVAVRRKDAFLELFKVK
ncbi:MAG TPA: LytTR family DNA-binding domain-containing protein [Chitinophagaceae bacterium]|nr:LytTR family DNA-binding domain-containing protein [Chitinophagaceae bacterium]